MENCRSNAVSRWVLSLQREGRILRQGNHFDEVEIFNYVTEGTLDSYLYQTVTDKARFIAQLLDDKCPARVSEDCDEKVLTFGEIQAAAEGNPDFRRRIELSNEIAELTMLKNAYAHETSVTQLKLESLPQRIAAQQERLAKIQQDKDTAAKISDIVLTTGSGKQLTERKEINTHLLRMIKQHLQDPNAESPTAAIGNFEISVSVSPDRSDARFIVKGETVYSCAAGMTENQDNCQRLSNLLEKQIPKAETDTQQHISDLAQNLEQAKERVQTPFAHDAELTEKQEELQQLEERLAGLSVQEDVLLDPEEDAELVVETREEKQKREAEFQNADADDAILSDQKRNDDQLEPPRRM